MYRLFRTPLMTNSRLRTSLLVMLPLVGGYHEWRGRYGHQSLPLLMASEGGGYEWFGRSLATACGLRRALMDCAVKREDMKSFVSLKPAYELATGGRNKADGMVIGSGIIFNQNGYVLTTAQVVANYSQLWVKLYEEVVNMDEKQVMADVIGHVVYVDVLKNMAIIKLDPPGHAGGAAGGQTPWKAFNLNENAGDGLKVGDKVFAITNPRKGIVNHVTDGIVSCAKRRGDLVNASSWTVVPNNYYVQHTAAVKSDDYGCPLFKVVGDSYTLIGMNCFQHKVHINVAIQVKEMAEFINTDPVLTIVNQGLKATFGIHLRDDLQIVNTNQPIAGKVTSIEGHPVANIDDVLSLVNGRYAVTIGTNGNPGILIMRTHYER